MKKPSSTDWAYLAGIIDGAEEVMTYANQQLKGKDLQKVS